MGDVAVYAAIASAVALVLSLLFLARQTRESARQSVLANELASTQALGDVYSAMDRILYRLTELPHLRKYFYDGVDFPVSDGSDASDEIQTQVLLIAELFADAIDQGLNTIGSVGPAADFRAPMNTYARRVISTSPSIRRLVQDRPGWWPILDGWLNEQSSN